MEEYKEEAINAIRNLFDAGDGHSVTELRDMLEQVRDEVLDSLSNLD